MLLSVRVLSFSLLGKTKTTHSFFKSYRRIHNIGINDIPRVTVTDIRKLLRQKGFSVQDGYTAITTKCSLCSSNDEQCDSKVYINKTTGE